MNQSDEQHENPRTVRVRRVILDSAVELLLAGGASEVTATRIAEETGVARTTIYRQWPDQASLLLATVDLLVEPSFPSPEASGDLRNDLTRALTNIRTRLATKQVRPVFGALADYAARDKSFVAAQRRFIDGIIEQTVELLEHTQQAGGLPGSMDCAMAATTLTGPLFHQFLVMRDTISDELIADVISQFLNTHAT